MESQQESLTLIQKLSKIRRIADAVSKSKRGYNYSYADITEILAKITAGMDKYGVSLIPKIVPGTASVQQNVVTNTKKDKQGNSFNQVTTEMLVSADMVFTWINNENESDVIDVPWFVTGSQADPSQALGSGLTYTTRQFLTNYFQIAQVDNDVDAYRSKQKEAEDREDREIAAAIIQQFDKLVKEYLGQHEGEADEVKKFISAYIKNANYLQIKDSNTASRLLEDFTNKYIRTEGA